MRVIIGLTFRVRQQTDRHLGVCNSPKIVAALLLRWMDGKEKERAPSDLKHLLDDVEFIDYERRDYKAKAMVDELIRRGGAVRPVELPPRHR